MAEKQNNSETNPNLKRLRVLLYLAIGLLVILIFILIIGIPLASSPSFCIKTCHLMNPEYQTWKRSSHSKIKCYACHVDDSYIGLSREKFIIGPRRAYLTITNSFKRPLNKNSDYSQKKMPSKRCLKCHEPSTRTFTTGDLKITRQVIVKHLKAGLECTTCHNRLVHNKAERYEPIKSWDKNFKYKNFLRMKEGCWRCHSNNPKYRDEKVLKLIKNGAKPPTRCDTCHTNPKNWLKSKRRINIE
jgi:nitrate/TMAO reductase-like tetraheme cytochrome c subunit